MIPSEIFTILVFDYYYFCCVILLDNYYQYFFYIITILLLYNNSFEVNLAFFIVQGVRHSSMVEHLLLVLWVFGSIPHGGPMSYFMFQPVFHEWCVGWCIKNTYLIHFIYSYVASTYGKGPLR